jgi:hypothetical protein
MMLHFSIPGRLPTNNELLRAHWSKRGRLKKSYLNFLRLQLDNPFPEEAAKVRARVHVTAYLRRRYDEDNLHGGVKVLLDALRAARLIYQDSPRWLDLQVDQYLDRENMRTEIFVKQLDRYSSSEPTKYCQADLTERRKA